MSPDGASVYSAEQSLFRLSDLFFHSSSRFLTSFWRIFVMIDSYNDDTRRSRVRNENTVCRFWAWLIKVWFPPLRLRE